MQTRFAITLTQETAAKQLRQFLDNEKAWTAFCKSTEPLTKGLLGIPSLARVPGQSARHRWTNIARLVERECRFMVRDIIDQRKEEHPVDRADRIIQTFDNLSDHLCSVMDVAEYVRHAHGCSKEREGAEVALQELGEQIQKWNQYKRLYNRLVHVTRESQRQFPNRLDPEGRLVAKHLIQDFEQSGIHLRDDKRNTVKSLLQKTQLLGHAFQQNASEWHATEQILLRRPLKELLERGLTPELLQGQSLSSCELRLTPDIAHSILSHVNDRPLRQTVYQMMHTATQQQRDRTHSLLFYRQSLASKMDMNYADWVLKRMKCNSREKVQSLLEIERQRLKAPVQALYATLNETLCRQHEPESIIGRPGNSSVTLHAWDVDFCLRKVSDEMVDLSSYFTVGSVMQGLSLICSHLFNVSLIPTALDLDSHVWSASVRRVNVVHAVEGHLGTLYLDLFHHHSHRSPQPAHYTIRCGRQWPTEHLNLMWRDANEFNSNGTSKTFQLPCVVVMHALPLDGKCTWPQIVSLFHEMGHALHSIFSRTRFQHLSGTRGSLDYVEFPSALFERLAQDFRVIQLCTCRPMPETAFQKHLQHHSHYIAPLEEMQTLMHASLDQACYAVDIGREAHSFPDRLQVQMKRTLQSLSLPMGTERNRSGNVDWHCHFPHLFGYGAVYFSYVAARQLADSLFQKLFGADPLSRESGEKLRQILSKGCALEDLEISLNRSFDDFVK